MNQAHAPLIEMKDVSFAYGSVKALDHVTGVFAAGSLTAVAGPNGAGKSTLLKAIAGIVRPQEGRIFIEPSVRDKIGYLPQTSTIERDYPLTVFQAASMGLWPQVGSSRSLSDSLADKVHGALKEVGLDGLEKRQVGALSGGQFQRLLFARLILQEPQVFLLDEPFAAVDAETIRHLMQIVMGWHAEGRTIICVLHDLLLIRKYFPESFLLAGKCLGRGHTHQLFEQKLLSFDLDMAELVAPKEHDHDPS